MKILVWGGVILGCLIMVAAVFYVIAGNKLTKFDDAARAKAPGQHIQLTDGQIHYRWDGPEEGPVVVLVHGFSTPNFIYEQNVGPLIDAGFRVLRFDHFGRGWSDRPRTKYDAEFYDRELLELMDGLGITDPVGLVGLSMGGPITAEFAARHPERVRKLFLFVPAGFDVAGADGAAGLIMRTPLLGDWVWRMYGRKILMSDPQYDETGLAPENRLAGDVTEQFQYRGYGEALLSTLRHFPLSDRDDIFERLGARGIPVMAVYGAADMTVLVSSADKLRALIPAADVRVLEGAEHGLNYQRHADVNPWLVEWFATDAN